MTYRTDGIAPLPAGSLIGVVAPAGPAEQALLAQLPGLYAAHGFHARLYTHGAADPPAAASYLAGSDDARLAGLHAALADPGVAAIHCLRGGYGCMRLLDRIDTALVSRARKPLIGYSDITALHALWCRAGVPSLHAPMPASDLLLPGAAAQADARALFAALTNGLPPGAVFAPLLDPSPAAAGLHAPGRADGMLIGGNLSLVAALLGTPWAWPVHAPGGCILFLEDVSEAPYRIDRLLTQLRLAGVLAAACGIVLGNFTGAEPPWPLLRQLLLPLNVPLLAGWPAGHGTPNRPLPLGVRVRLDAGAGSIALA